MIECYECQQRNDFQDGRGIPMPDGWSSVYVDYRGSGKQVPVFICPACKPKYPSTEDALRARIAELEAENERLAECDGTLNFILATNHIKEALEGKFEGVTSNADWDAVRSKVQCLAIRVKALETENGRLCHNADEERGVMRKLEAAAVKWEAEAKALEESLANSTPNEYVGGFAPGTPMPIPEQAKGWLKVNGWKQEYLLGGWMGLWIHEEFPKGLQFRLDDLQPVLRLFSRSVGRSPGQIRAEMMAISEEVPAPVAGVEEECASKS